MSNTSDIIDMHLRCIMGSGHAAGLCRDAIPETAFPRTHLEHPQAMEWAASLPWRKEALRPDAYPCLMTCRILPLCLRMAATLLVVLGLLASAQVKAATPFAGPLMAVEICHDDQLLTIWLDADGNEHPAPHDCRDCDLCGGTVPAIPAFSASSTLQTATRCVVWVSHCSPGAPRPDYLIPPLRGPPSHHNRIASA